MLGSEKVIIHGFWGWWFNAFFFNANV